jgi:hypothetical protein
MDKRSIFSKTAKGLGEASGRTSDLPRALRNILKEIDGKATVRMLVQKIGDTTEPELMEALRTLEKEGYAREMVTAPKDVGSSSPIPAASGLDDLDFTSTIGPLPAARLHAAERLKAEVKEISRGAPAGRALEEAEAKAKGEAAARARAEAVIRARLEVEAQAKAEAATRTKAEAQAKAKADAEAKTQADALATAKAKAEAGARAKAEAEAKASAEAKAKSLGAALERVKQDAEERVRRDAEERTRQEAERSRKEAAQLPAQLEQQRKEREDAERGAREQAERLARRRSEEQAGLEAEERARRDEERSRFETQERARIEAEFNARLQAERKARAEAEERARFEAEARANQEAAERARRDAEEAARRGAEARARREFEEKARLEAEEKARSEAQRQGRRDAEEAVRREQERHIRLEREQRSQEQERRAAEEKARAEESERRRGEDAEGANREAEGARARAAVEERKRSDDKRLADEKKWAKENVWAEAAGSEPRAQAAYLPAHQVMAGRRRRRSFAKPVALGLSLVLVAAFGAIHFIALDPVPFENAATSRFGRPVRIGSINIAFFPVPQFRMEGIVIGEQPQIKIASARAVPEFGFIFQQRKVYQRVEVEGVILPQSAIGASLFGKSNDDSLRIDRVVAKGLKFDIAGLTLQPLDIDVTIAAGGVQKIVVSNADKKLHGTLQADGNKFQIELAARPLRLPFAPAIELDEFSGSGTISSQELILNTFAARAYDGSLQGNARLRWGDNWSFDGELAAKQMNAAAIAAPLLGSGKLGAKGVYSMRAPSADKLLPSLRLEASVTVQKGSIGRVDLPRVLQGADSTGGTTLFSELNGSIVAEHMRLRVPQLRLTAGLMSASGSLEVDAQKNLSGRLQVELRAQSTQANAALAISGTLANPQFRRAK